MAERPLPRNVKKRDGSIVAFNEEKIRYAIERAAFEVRQDKKAAATVAAQVTAAVLKTVAARYKGRVPSVEAIQDTIEKALMEAGYAEIARAYIRYRQRRTEIRLAKSAWGQKDDLKLPINAMEVLKKRYLLKDDHRTIIETPGELFRRVAAHVAQTEGRFKSSVSVEEAQERFYQMMRNLEFMPNSPTLMNAGTALGQLSACFVIPVEDSMDGIFTALKDMAKIHQTGGGTGFNFSRLRPQGDLVASTKGEASGPVSFMSIFDQATAVIVQGGKRRGANMGILRCDHPDIIEFIEAKTEKGRFANFNLSVGVIDRFMEAVKGNRPFDLINPRTRKPARTIKAGSLFDLIVNAAWRTGDPGLIFLDEINRRNPTPGVGPIEATNPCGELPLLPYESCNLASINLARMVRGDSLDWERLKDRVTWGIRFLDNVIDVNTFPLPEVAQITFANRKIGLGVMGFADMLIRLGIPYTSSKAIQFAARLMHFIRTESLNASMALAHERGVFPNFERSIYAKNGMRVRNATVNTIAPTGTISIIANCSSGIEPLFAISFVRNVLSGTKLFEVSSLFEEMARKRGIYSQELLVRIAQQGSLQHIKEIPRDIRTLFVTAFDVSPKQHLLHQAAFQRYTDNSVSKTVNLPSDASVDDVRRTYVMAHQLKCKGITIYRYGSKEEQVLSFDYRREGGREEGDMLAAESEYSGGCVSGTCLF
ncbi:MAG: adenosylcobalamin-dependent ribonucleoside-diphosphate reductase [Deltaproteobacteria bacterium]|nr:adenosylcobalamin-dependent ribonucleoside-diphosphate reductase [Deltaproteobacteria bacterium]